MLTLISPDYQQFRLVDGKPVDLGSRMRLKLEAIPLPELKGKTVLDIGCDFGFWSWLSAEKGATVLGLDRNREVRGRGFTDLIAENNATAEAAGLPCRFKHINLGKEWREFGQFDVLFMFSLYHHVFEACGDHLPIWYWLWRHCKKDTVLLWENPLTTDDVVVRKNVAQDKWADYTPEKILGAASGYFTYRHIGPAKHEPYREVYEFRPKNVTPNVVRGRAVDGAGGASEAFNHDNGRRIREIEAVTGMRCVPGSFNVKMEHPFDWDRHYYRAQILDVKERGKGLNVPWAPRWARFYPVYMGVPAFVFRFEGEKYRDDFAELISSYRLRDLAMNPPQQRANAVLSRLGGEVPVGAEVGVFKAGMSRELLKRPDLLLYMVDSWADPGEQPDAYRKSGDYHARLSEVEQLRFMEEAKRFTEFAADRRFIVRKPSIDAAKDIADGILDFVFIDADHSYEGVKADIEAWYPKVKPGGWLCGHDWETPGHSFGVERAVKEFAEREGKEIVLDVNTTWFIQC